MWLIIASLVIGIVLGISGTVPVWILKHLNRVTTVTLFIMLAALGAQIGSDSKLLGNITILGWRAFLISALSVLGSIAALWLVSRYFKLLGQEGDKA